MICYEAELLNKINHVLIPETQRYIDGLIALQDTGSDLYRELLGDQVIPKVRLVLNMHFHTGTPYSINRIGTV